VPGSYLPFKNNPIKSKSYRVTLMKNYVLIIFFLPFFITGCLVLTIEPEMNNPFIITLDGTKEVLQKGEEMTITVSVTDENGAEVVPDSYEWYLQGAELPENDSTITIGSSLETGIYVLDIVITKASIMSSESFTFDVVE